MRKPPLVVIGPVPPPVHGVTISTSLVLGNEHLREHFDVHHLDTSDRRASLQNIGRWDIVNVLLGLKNALQLALQLRGPSGVVYLPISQSAPAFLRDSLFIHVAALQGWRVALHLRGSEFDEFYDTAPPLLRRWIRCTFRCVTSVAVMGESLRHLFDALVRADRIAVVPNGTPDFPLDPDVREPHTVLCLGNLLERKGLYESLDAALRIVAGHPGARVVFAGQFRTAGEAAAARERVAAAAGRIEFLPPVAGFAKRAVLQRASLLLFPPVRPEGHPRVILEAMAAGMPVVTTDRGAIAETVLDGVTGYVLPDPDPAALADRVLAILHDDDLRRRMSEAARNRYLERYTQPLADELLARWLATLVRQTPRTNETLSATATR